MRSDKIENSFLFGENSIFVEELYSRYLADKTSVSEEWQKYFANLQEGQHSKISTLNKTSWALSSKKVIGADENIATNTKKTEKIAKEPSASATKNLTYLCLSILQEYRMNGHLLADLDPLGLEKKYTHHNLGLEQYNFSHADYNEVIDLPAPNEHFSGLTLEQFIKLLQKIYCKNTGYELQHVFSNEQKNWLLKKIETEQEYNISNEEQKKALNDLIEVEGFEQFIHNRFPGAKRFSIEGGDSSIIAISEIIRFASEQNSVQEMVIGMAHRGRLNVLTKIMQKPYKIVLSEFFGNVLQIPNLAYSGDVKYHLGKSSDLEFANGKKIHLSLTPNPSHLEAVNPVVQGKVRAKQDIINDTDRKKVAGLLLHGDAAFSGQGIIAEGLMLGDLEGYNTGGTMHIVINNQIGFTTTAKDARLSRYPTEFAKIIQAPIIHVNGDSVLAVLKAARLAEEFRFKFKKDVVLDIVCYRKYGHNEGDEPLFTQPIMYENIKAKKSVANLYSKDLLEQKIIDENYYTAKVSDFQKYLDEQYNEAKSFKQTKADWLEGLWSKMKPSSEASNVLSTGVSENIIKEVGKALCTYPEGFNINSKVKRLLEAKKQMFESGKNLDWGTAEALAYGTLLLEGKKVRMTGQDSKRGTFSHRHAVLFDQKTENEYTSLNHIRDDQAFLEIHNSNLSEYAVLGFEYGYSTVSPNHLTIWEAQFGDFANGAQIIIDQFISSAETKWLRMSGLVMLLPHGYEGQGPEHSSARLERFLQLSAEKNIQVVNCTTPANFFHVMRRQVIGRNFRKPLIVMTPKSILRHKLLASDISEFTGDTSFKEVLDDKYIENKKNVRKIILCSGKIYYDLLEKRVESSISDVAIVRLEQYYPFPDSLLKDILKTYNADAEIFWCQEEPRNMGAWKFVVRRIEDILAELKLKQTRISYIGRQRSASTAEGYAGAHLIEQARIINEALK